MDLKVETVLVYGDSGVGKTSVVHRFLNQSEPSQQEKSPLKYSGKKFSQTGSPVFLKVYDISGEKAYGELWSTYVKQSKFIVLVFDVHNAESFQNVRTHFETAKDKENSQLKTQYFLIGNKCDLSRSKQRQVSEKDARSFADENGLIYIETSARTGQGIDALQAQILKIAWQSEDLAVVDTETHCVLWHLELVEHIYKFQTAWEKNPFMRDLCVILKTGTQDVKPQFYFTAKLPDFKKNLRCLGFTWRSVLNSILNVAMTASLAVSLVGVPLLAGLALTNLAVALVGFFLLGLFTQTNKKASGHSCMFFAFGERQAAQVMCHEVFTQLDTSVRI